MYSNSINNNFKQIDNNINSRNSSVHINLKLFFHGLIFDLLAIKELVILWNVHLEWAQTILDLLI